MTGIIEYVIQRYQAVKAVHPEWSTIQKLSNTVSGLVSFFRMRIDTVLFLLTGFFPYTTHIEGKSILDVYAPDGRAIFITVHSGPYPLAGRILKRYFPSLRLAVPFYVNRKLSIFPIYRKYFRKLDISIIPLGGAMPEIESVVKKGGSICLFLDAALPVKHTAKVRMFGRTIHLTTGPIFLAKKFNLPIIPISVMHKHHGIIVTIDTPIVIDRKNDQHTMNSLAVALETLINRTISQWQIMDRFLTQ